MANGEDPIHEELRRSGWRQGCLVPDEVSKRLCKENGLSPTKGWRLFVITHSCDLLQDADREPLVEIIAACQVEEIDPQCVNGRNPRTLHLPADSTTEGCCLEFEARNRIVADKNDLRSHHPVTNGGLTPSALRVLTKWIAKRYSRPAFPDEFNRRLDAASKKLETLWKNSKTKVITGVFVAGAEGELSAAQDYVLEIRLTAPSTAWGDADSLKALEYVVRRLEEILGGCAGIAEVDVLAVPEEDFPMSDLRIFKRLDKDYRTLPVDDYARRLPNHADET